MNSIMLPICGTVCVAHMLHILCPLAFSMSEFISEILNPYRHCGRTPWMVNWPISRPLPTQDITTQKKWISMSRADDPSV
jgi:hypothetical protein